MKKKYIILTILTLFMLSCQEKGAENFYQKGLVKASKQNFENALINFNTAISMDSTNPVYYFDRAFYAKENLGDFSGAIEDYTIAIDMVNGDNDANAYSNRGHAQMMLEKYKDAITDIQKAISLDPNNSYSFRNRALLFIEIKNMNMACVDLQQSLDLGFTDSYGDEVKELIEKYCTK